MTLFKYAQLYHQAGLCVIPLKPKSKQPAVAWEEYQKRRPDASERWSWFGESPGRNIAIVCGQISGGSKGVYLVVVDFDDDEVYRRWGEEHRTVLLSTWVARTAHGHHVYLRVKQPTRTFPIEGGDMKGEGGYVVAPPSTHPEGGQYVFVHSAGDIALVDNLAQIGIVPKGSGERGPAPPVGDKIKSGSRDVTLTSLAGTMRRRGVGYDAILAALLEVNKQRCEPPLQEAQVQKIAYSVARYKPAEAVAAAVTGEGPKGEPAVGWTVYLADAITGQDHFARDRDGLLYHYEAGVYRPTGEQYIAERTKELLASWGAERKWSRYRVKEVIAFIRVDAAYLWSRPPLDTVNVLNGLLKVKTGRLEEHTPDYLCPIQLPVVFRPEARCERWYDFAEAVFPEDCQDLPFELCAWLMLPLTSIQKAVLLLGEGANGKSRFLEALKSFLGVDNVTGVSLHKLERGRFEASRLVGKLANICPDLPTMHLSSTSTFKALTGGDPIHGERKYRPSFEFGNFSRLVFSANHPPQSADSSKAFWRRWLVVPFMRTFSPDDGDYIPAPQLDALLGDPKELSGVLNHALIALPKVLDQGLMESESMREAWFEFREVTDPVQVWLDQHTVEGTVVWAVKGDLLKEYNRDAREGGRPPMTASLFAKAVRRWRPRIQDAHKRVGEKQVWAWLGIGLRIESANNDKTSGKGGTSGTSESLLVDSEQMELGIRDGGQ